MTALQIIFLITAIVTLGSACMVVFTRRIMHAALWLVLALLGVAILFATLQSGFFAVVQVLVYIGAIATLFIFAVMMTRKSMDDTGSQSNRGWGLALVGSLALFFGITAVLLTWGGAQTELLEIPTVYGEDIQLFGLSLVDPMKYLIPFEVASVLLMAALVAAIFLTVDVRRNRS
ncbi:NADH dehydrogenase subunit J [Longilinea arvoryzae]|uniref:NADH-quinone oxidoreductase subunit J n=1 Tax=Longilinea arvoryzae TaxID=360412 RepID=A0A0S7BJJ9_9CHLR|nr:NADH-quinone oxidoreductase subunit J [Longilinea arvoryzae]GAP15280.1 NADH dehydrogenase subunit J [Longilinea arvoryzae]